MSPLYIFVFPSSRSSFRNEIESRQSTESLVETVYGKWRFYTESEGHHIYVMKNTSLRHVAERRPTEDFLLPSTTSLLLYVLKHTRTPKKIIWKVQRGDEEKKWKMETEDSYHVEVPLKTLARSPLICPSSYSTSCTDYQLSAGEKIRWWRGKKSTFLL